MKMRLSHMRTTHLDYNASMPIDPGVTDAMRPLLAEVPIGLMAIPLDH